MYSVLVSSLNSTLCINFQNTLHISDIKEKVYSRFGIPTQEQRLSLNSKPLADDFIITSSNAHNLPPIRVSLRLLGGKGGFGALLRGQGAKAGSKKTANFDDCRDLNGRRIRDIKNEKKLSEWYSEQKRKEQEEQQKQARKRANPLNETVNVILDDAKFIEERKKIEESIENAVEVGIQQAIKLQQKKNQTQTEQPKKKQKVLWDEFDDGDEETDTYNKDSIEEETTISTLTTSTTVTTTTEENEKNNEDNNGAVSEEAIEIEKKETIKEEEQQITITINLDEIESVEQLEKYGLEKLKMELQGRGMLCGGTLNQRATRLFSVKGIPLEEIPQNLKPKENKNVNNKKKKKN